MSVTSIIANHHASKKPPIEENIFWSKLDYLITENKEHFEIDPQYADDINWITTNKLRINELKKEIPKQPKQRDLQENDSKREEYHISRDSDEKWKTCKVLVTLLDTFEDFKRRKILTRI